MILFEQDFASRQKTQEFINKLKQWVNEVHIQDYRNESDVWCPPIYLLLLTLNVFVTADINSSPVTNPLILVSTFSYHCQLRQFHTVIWSISRSSGNEGQKGLFVKKGEIYNPLDAEHKLNVHEMSKGPPGRFLNVLFKFNLHPVFWGK